MSRFRHTTGPRRVIRYDQNGPHYTPAGVYLSVVSRNRVVAIEFRNKHDAILDAAAPKLLRALKRLITHMDEDTLLPRTRRDLRFAQDAVADATKSTL